MMASQRFKLALIQMLPGPDKAANIQKAVAKVAEAANEGAKIVVLPEIFNSPFGTQFFAKYSEPISGPTVQALQEVAKEKSVYLIGGSIPEQKDGRLFNSCPLIKPNGEMAGVFRKIHLFDVNVPGGIQFQESETLSPGAEPMIFKTEYCNIGIGICYDIRFNELSNLYARSKCQLLVYPAAFNMTTGPAHWKILATARALDNQAYTALCSPARDATGSYVAWGHSMITSPWGEVVASAEVEECIIYAELDMDRVESVRKMIPIGIQRRTDIFDTVENTPVKFV